VLILHTPIATEVDRDGNCQEKVKWRA
jgi:hypothetical protein